MTEYLTELAKEGRALSTLQGHKSCICETLRLGADLDLKENTALSSLMKSFKLDRPRALNVVPKWNLLVVLRGLRQTPFEPLEDIDLKFLTYKTVLLVALASAARVSEIGALSMAPGHIKFKEDDSSVKLFPFDGFLAKNQRSDEPPRHIKIKSLRRYAPQDDPERLLCPLRALKAYLKRTKQIRGDRKRLFISHVKNFSREITTQTIANYIKQTITLCYQLQAPAELETQCHASAHEVRAIATSTRLWLTNSVASLLKAANWKNHNTFTSFYFRDMTNVTRTAEVGTSGTVVCGRMLALDL